MYIHHVYMNIVDVNEVCQAELPHTILKYNVQHMYIYTYMYMPCTLHTLYIHVPVHMYMCTSYICLRTYTST